MTVTSIDIDQDILRQAKALSGTTTGRETVDLALRTLIAVRRQPVAVERIIARHLGPDGTRVPAPVATDSAHIAPVDIASVDIAS